MRMSHPKIESVELRRYRLPLDPPFRAAWDPEPRRALDVTVVRVIAGEYEGVGAGGPMPGFPGNEPLFLRRDPFDIERHVEILDNLQFLSGRMWPLEVALWDLMGKIEGEPLWRMLGGTEGRVRVYASTGERVGIKERVERARDMAAAGYPAIKLRMYSDDPLEEIEVVQEVREAVGGDVELMVDANQGWRMAPDTREPWTLETAIAVADALSELDVFWLEEPLDRHYYRGMAELRQRSGVRIAGGEGACEAVELEECLRHGSLDVYQPDVAWSIGVSRIRRLAAKIAEAGAMYTPHTWGDGLVLLANLHVAAALSNAPFVEYPYDPPVWTPDRRDFLLPEPLLSDGDGYLTLPEGPGLGVELDWAGIEPLRVESGR